MIADRWRGGKGESMETLAGYIGWMGDYSFEACPFREADALVLCLIAYFDLSPVFADGKRTAHVRDCAQMVDAGEAKLLITGGDLGNTEIFTAAVRSRRFGDLEITDAVDVLQENPPLQFAAVTFHDGSNFSFIAYRGTDSSLAGWKENFMISFTRTAAQEMALQYASERIAEYRLAGKRKWYIGGHSKGGNLALYASCMLADEDLLAVDRVFLLDGPGLCPEVLDAKLVKRIDSRATMITPEYDIIGSIFSPEIADSRIIRSYRDGIVQHSLASWLVDHGDLALAERHSLFSDRLNLVLDECVEKRPLEDRAAFVDEMFDAFEKSGVTDFEKMTIDKFAEVLTTLRSASKTTKDFLSEFTTKALFDKGPEIPENTMIQIRKGALASAAGLLKLQQFRRDLLPALAGIGVLVSTDRLLIGFLRGIGILLLGYGIFRAVRTIRHYLRFGV